MIDTLITSRVRRKIVTVYAKYPDYKTHIRGLSFLIKEDVGNVYRELCRLEKSGFLFSSKKGRIKIYSADKKFPLLKHLNAIVLYRSANNHQIPNAQSVAATDISKLPGAVKKSKKIMAAGKVRAFKKSKAALKSKAKAAVDKSRAAGKASPRAAEA